MELGPHHQRSMISCTGTVVFLHLANYASYTAQKILLIPPLPRSSSPLTIFPINVSSTSSNAVFDNTSHNFLSISEN